MQERLLVSLGVQTAPLALVYGYSSAATLALRWAALFPQFATKTAAVCGVLELDPTTKVALEAMEMCLRCDTEPLGAAGWYEAGPGQRAFVQTLAAWSLGEDTLNKPRFLEALGYATGQELIASCFERHLLQKHPLDLIAELSMWRLAGRSQAEASSITGRVLYVAGDRDRLITPTAVRDEAERITGTALVVPLPSVWGHKAGDTGRPGLEGEAVALATHVSQLLGRRR